MSSWMYKVNLKEQKNSGVWQINTILYFNRSFSFWQPLLPSSKWLSVRYCCSTQ